MTDLCHKKCLPCEGGVTPFDSAQAKELLAKVQGWELDEKGHEIRRNFSFKNFYHTMAFVNAIAWIANRENHHPDLEVSYQHCLVRFSTHAINGLSENDFICAAKINALTETA